VGEGTSEMLRKKKKEETIALRRKGKRAVLQRRNNRPESLSTPIGEGKGKKGLLTRGGKKKSRNSKNVGCRMAPLRETVKWPRSHPVKQTTLKKKKKHAIDRKKGRGGDTFCLVQRKRRRH